MIDTSKILTQADQYAFSLFDVNLIDFDMLEYDKNGIISLPLITSNLPKPNEPFDDEDTMTMITDAIDYGDMWFTYNAIDHKVEELVVEIHCIQQQISFDNALCFMEQIQHPEYEQYKMSYDKFVANIKGELKKQIRKLMTEVKGEFSKDNFIKDTYFQVRQFGDKEIFYVIHNWWKGLCDGEINFVDVVNGEGTVFIARCKGLSKSKIHICIAEFIKT